MRGTPAYMVAFNKKKTAIESESLIGFSGSSAGPDNHNIPGACVGAEHTVHVVLPGHQETLRLRSGTFDGARIKWTPSHTIGEAPTSFGGYTYASLNCDRKGNIYITSRWAGDGYRFQLVFLHRSPDGQWKRWANKEHKVLVDPGRTFYGAWRQKVTLDSEGHLFLWYAYYPNQVTKDELTQLKWRFPFKDWTELKALQPSLCLKDKQRRCFLHPMPELTSVNLQSSDSGKSWHFLN